MNRADSGSINTRRHSTNESRGRLGLRAMWWRLLLGLAVLLIVGQCLYPQMAWGRAGDGQGYSGGSSSGGSGGWSGGGSVEGGGDLIWLLIQLCIHYPKLAIPLVVAGVGIFLLMSYSAAGTSQRAYRGHVIRRANREVGGRIQEEATEKLRASDPAFDLGRFQQRVGTAFQRIQAAWSQQDLSPVRSFLSDGVYERFSLQIIEQRSQGFRNAMEGVAVHLVAMVELERDPHFDAVTMRINATARDYRVSLESGQEIPGFRHSGPFAEYWTFVRRRGVKTTDRPGLLEGACPNCGAEVSLNRQANCASCGSLLRSGEYDWVLVEITQEIEWLPNKDRAVPGLSDYVARHDPGFNPRLIEDRASVIFWRKVISDRMGSVEPLFKMADDEFCTDYAARLSPSRTIRGDCAVGDVSLLCVRPGEPFDQAIVAIRWAGQAYEIGSDGSAVKTSTAALFRNFFVLGRRPGVKTDVGHGLSTTSCPTCGAPETNLASHSCEFCGTVLNDGGHDWILTEILDAASDEGQSILAGIGSLAHTEGFSTVGSIREVPLHEPIRLELLAWSIQAALADRELDLKERKILEKAARRRGLSNEKLEVLINAARAGNLPVEEPRDQNERRKLMVSLADMGLADGRIDPREFEFLCQAGAGLEYSPRDVQYLLKQRQAQLYKQARENLRAKKRADGDAAIG
jgi:hypothetical protein